MNTYLPHLPSLKSTQLSPKKKAKQIPAHDHTRRKTSHTPSSAPTVPPTLRRRMLASLCCPLCQNRANARVPTRQPHHGLSSTARRTLFAALPAKICSCQGNIPSYRSSRPHHPRTLPRRKQPPCWGVWHHGTLRALSFPLAALGEFPSASIHHCPRHGFHTTRSTPRARQRFLRPFSRPPWRHVGPQIGHLLPLSDIQPHSDRATRHSHGQRGLLTPPFPHHVRMLRRLLFDSKPRRNFSGF